MPPSSLPASGSEHTPISSSLSTPRPTDSTPTTPAPTSHTLSTHTTESNTETTVQNAEKRIRACDSCRGLKVRCDLDEADPTGACKRCKKASRECIFTAPTKKRQKKSDSKVAELERKIDALTATLQTARAPVAGDTIPTLQDKQGPGPVSIRTDLSAVETKNWKDPVAFGQTVGDWRREELPGHAAKRRRTGADSNAQQVDIMELTGMTHADMLPFMKHQAYYSSLDTPPEDDIGPVGDVVDRELLSIEAAGLLYRRFNTELAVLFPVVVFPADYPVEKLRAEKPVLFLAVLAVSSGLMHPALYKALNKELIKVLAEKAVINGNKSLELVQSYLLSTVWYFAPNRLEELKFYQLLHMALAMALDLGLGSRATAGCGSARRMVGPSSNCQSKQGSATAPPPSLHQAFDKFFRLRGRTSFPDPTALESRRIFVGLYVSCLNIAMSLRRPTMIRYSNYIGESIKLLETSPEARPSDRMLIEMAKLQKIGEDVFLTFEFEDPAANISITEPRIQLSLRSFIQRLEEWKANVPAGLWNDSLHIMYLTMTCFTNEISLQPPGQPPSEKDLSTVSAHVGPSLPANMTALHVESVSRLATAAHTILNILVASEVDNIRAFPVFQLARGVYASVILLRLSIHSQRNQNLKTLFDDLNVDTDALVGKVIEKFKEVASDDKCRPATKFFVVLTMVRNIARMKRARLNSKVGAAGDGQTGPYRQECPHGHAHQHDQPHACPISQEIQMLVSTSERHEENPDCPLLRSSVPPPSSNPSISSPPLNRQASDMASNADSPLHMLSTVAHERAQAAQPQQQKEMRATTEHPTPNTPSGRSTSTYAPPPEKMVYPTYSPSHNYNSQNAALLLQQQQRQQQQQQPPPPPPQQHTSTSNIYQPTEPNPQNLQQNYFNGMGMGGFDYNGGFLGISSDEFPDLSTGMGQDFGASMDFIWQTSETEDPFSLFPTGQIYGYF